MSYYDRDIVFLDFETSGVWPDEGADPLTMGAVRVDRKTLETTRTFHAELVPQRPEEASENALAVNGLDLEQLAEEGKQPAEVIRLFERDIFGISYYDPETWPENIRTEVYLSSWNTSFDVERFMNHLLRAATRARAKYGYHHLDLWTIAAHRWAMANLPWPETGLHFGDLCRMFDLERDEDHSALQDSFFGAEIFKELHQPGSLEHAWAAYHGGEETRTLQ